MIIGRHIKQPAETLDYDCEFADFLSDGDVLMTNGANPAIPAPLDVVATPSGLTLGPTWVLADGTTVKQWISGGTDGVKYKITLTVTTGAGRVVQVEFYVTVKDQ